jgi:hypothetical protein
MRFLSMKKILIFSLAFFISLNLFSEHPTLSVFVSMDNILINDSNVHNGSIPQALKNELGDAAFVGSMNGIGRGNKDIEYRVELSFQDHFCFGMQSILGGQGRFKGYSTETYDFDIYIESIFEYYGLYFLLPENRGMYFGVGAFTAVIEAYERNTTDQYFRDFADLEFKIGFRENWKIANIGYITVGFEGSYMIMTQSARYGVLGGFAF